MRRTRGVAAAGLLVLATSFLPWFHSRWAQSRDGVDSYATNYATAWTASTGWTVAILLALAATVLWFFVRNRWAAPALAAGAVAVTVWAWQRVPAEPTGPLGWVASTGGGPGIGDIERDRLIPLHIDGNERDFAWGLHAGLAAMVLLVVVLAWVPAPRRTPAS